MSVPETLDTFIDKRQSPYAFESVPNEAREAMTWEGTLLDVCADIDGGNAVLSDNFWHPARLVWGVMNSSLAGESRVSLIRQATNFAVATYAEGVDDSNFRCLTGAIEHAGIENTPIKQVGDWKTLEASKAELSLRSAQRLQAKAPESALIVPVCHSGLVAGIQTALFRHRLQNVDTVVYPVRYSRIKHQDGAAYIPPEDLHYMSKVVGHEATVVVHDEDASTGVTIYNLIKYMTGKMAARSMLGLVNHDYRTQAWLEFNGEWWERAAQ